MKRPWKPSAVVIVVFIAIFAVGGCPEDREAYLRNVVMRKCSEEKAAMLLRIVHLERNIENLKRDLRKLKEKSDAE